MTGNPLELFRTFFGAVRANFWLCGSFLALMPKPSAFGCGRPRLWVMDVRTEMLVVFQDFEGPTEVLPGTSAGISAWTSAGYPAPKLTLWAAFSFLTLVTPPRICVK